ncbi:MAG: PHP domain-containing protein [Spirochaetales bacterium]|nr:PHP domain-containing protein [Spirochaetales bacterium]
MFDFHCHSSHSDGELSPGGLVALAAKHSLKAISLTDHDVVSGIPEAVEKGRELGVDIIPGIELSLGFMGGEIHLLGYGIAYDDPVFRQTLTHAQQVRESRNVKIIEKMREQGIEVDYDDIRSIAGGDYPGRPHFAELLVKRRIARNIKDAFARFLGNGKPLFVQRDFISLEDGIDMITSAGGIPVIAHPLSLMISWSRLMEYLKRWHEMGIRGIEGYYPEHSPGKCERLIAAARDFGFLITGGSDFHGKSKPHNHLGRTTGNMKISPDMVKSFLMELAYSPIM